MRFVLTCSEARVAAARGSGSAEAASGGAAAGQVELQQVQAELRMLEAESMAGRILTSMLQRDLLVGLLKPCCSDQLCGGCDSYYPS